MPEHFDAIVIGAGQAAPALCARLDREGLRTALVERKLLGGTCVNTGCIPTKTLIASARAAHMARRAGEYGVVLDSPPRVDMHKVKARMDAVVRRSSQGLADWLAGMRNVTLLRGHARFAAPHQVSVGSRLLEAERIFLDVGARAAAPPLPGLEHVAYLDNSSMMELDFAPQHLLIVGGSYVGLEFAQMYRRFGSQVTVIERGPRLIAREDEDVAQAVREIVEGEGVAVRTGAECMALERHGAGVRLALACGEGAPVAEGSHVLIAVGRQANTADLGLEAAGIEVDARGHIRVDDECRTNVEGVWALGEANGRGAFTHTSYNDYEIVAGNLFDGERRRISQRITAYALFIDPPLGRAGMSEAEARELAGREGRTVLAAMLPMERVGRAREAGETLGFMKVLVDAGTKELLGAAILGMHGDEVVHGLLDMMYAKAPYTSLQRAVHIHPTVNEFIPTLLSGLKPLV
jgi:pyruvate/2-oxoglutarate dehydrogenase complex dihydrolipoamide dehydrogenase (E3) component